MENFSFYLKCLELKDMPRAGWVLRKVKKPETVASHLWGTGLMALLYAKRFGYNEQKCIKLAIVHDLVEAYTGDTPTDKKFLARKNAFKKKKQQETLALKKLLKLIKDKKTKNEFEKLSIDYINKKSKEARFVSDLGNCIETTLQAVYYAKNKRTKKSLLEFFETSYLRVYTGAGLKLLDDVFFEFLNVKDLRL